MKKAKIAIIGAGAISSTLARKLSAAGHFVRIANSRGPKTLEEVVGQTGGTGMTIREAILGVEVVVLSVPFGSLPLLRWLLSGLPEEVVVADTSNYFPHRDGPIAEVDAGQVESQWVSAQIGRPVIKAWNNVLAATMADKGLPPGSEGRIALPVAGDDAADKGIVMSLVQDIGFDAIDGGGLNESWRQQPITRAYCTDLPAEELRIALLAVDRARAANQRDLIMSEFMSQDYELTTEEIVRLNRALGA